MMVLMQYDRLVVSLRLSLALSMLKMKQLVLKYLIIHSVFFFQMFDCVRGCIFFISSIIYISGCLPEFALYVPFFLCVLVHNLITALFTLHSSCCYASLYVFFSQTFEMWLHACNSVWLCSRIQHVAISLHISSVCLLAKCGYIHVILFAMHHVQLTASVKPRVNKSDACDEQLTVLVHVAFPMQLFPPIFLC